MEEIILKSENFLVENHDKEFPRNISAPVMAFFANTILKHELTLSHQDLANQAKVLIIESELEEFNYCINEFSEAIATFTETCTQRVTVRHSAVC